MVKENKSMLNHLNIIALNNYSPNSQTETAYSKLSHLSSNMAILKSSPKINNKQPNQITSNQNINSLSNHMHHVAQTNFRNGHHTSNRNPQNTRFSGVYEVYNNNLLEGSRLIRQLGKCNDIVAIDTEFPGVVCRVNGEYTSTTSLSYHNIKCNTDLMKPIQIGFSFFNQNGEQSEVNATVQFNLKWDMDTEVFAEESILLLENSGIDFHEHKVHGIDIQDFAEVFLASGLPLNEKITWIGFHCAYDWAYMIKICTNLPDMPESHEEFSELLLLYFPKTIDIKTIMSDKNLPKSGLQDLARSLNIERIGVQHQAGSDAKLTGDTFFNFFKIYCNGVIDDKYINLIYGLNYYPTSGANMLWLPNQSPTPEDLENQLTHNCRSVNHVTSIRDRDLTDDLFCYCNHQNFNINDSVIRDHSSSISSCADSAGRSSRESCAHSQIDSLDES